MTNVPFIDLKPCMERAKEKGILDKWQDALENCEFVGGPTVTSLEQTLAEKASVESVVCCANGTDALLILLQTQGVQRGAKVALPNLTFWASFEAVHHLGAQPILLDCDEHDLQLSVIELRKAHEEFKLDAVVLVHLFGWTSSRLFEIREYCHKEGIKLIEDSAQAYGVEVSGESVFQGASCSSLSFYPAKVIGAAGDAGAMYFRDASQAQIARSFANHGRSEHYSYARVGWNSRMNGLQAHYLLSMLSMDEDILQSRRNALEFYKEGLELSEKARLVVAPEGQKSNAYLCVLRVEASLRDRLVAALKEEGIGVGCTYPETMAEQKPAEHSLKLGDLAHSTQFTKEVVNLPLFSFMTSSQLESVVETFNRCIRTL